MKTVSFTEFRRRASGLITAVEHGETLVVIRHGRPVAEISPVIETVAGIPSWKHPGLRFADKGGALSAAILAEREVGM